MYVNLIFVFFLFSFEKFPQEQLHNFEVCNEIDECSHRVEFEDKLAVATSKLHIRTMPLQQNIFCYDPSQNIRNYLNTFMIRSDYSKKRVFNDVLKRIVASGIISKWKKDLRLYPETKRKQNSEEVRSLRFSDFYFTVVSFIPLVGISIMALTAEFIIHNKAHSMNATYYWKFLEKAICGKRYFFLLEPIINENDDVVIPFIK